MITEKHYACGLEVNDYIVVDNEVIGRISLIDDNDNETVSFEITDDDGERDTRVFDAFDILDIVASWGV